MLLPVSLCRVQVTGSLVVKRCDLSWASSSLVFNWFYQSNRFFISILFLNPYTRNCKDMRPQGCEKKQTHEDRKLDRLLSTSSLLLSILCRIAIFHMDLRIQEHRQLISHSSSGTFRDEMETEILRKVQQECGSWQETKESYLKGYWQTTTLC